MQKNKEIDKSSFAYKASSVLVGVLVLAFAGIVGAGAYKVITVIVG